MLHGSDSSPISKKKSLRLKEAAKDSCVSSSRSEIQLIADAEGQLCKYGSQQWEVQEETINTRDLQVLVVSDALWK